MAKDGEVTTLEGLLDEIVQANEGKDPISIDAAFKAIGRRSFGPLLLLPGLIAFSPLSGIPGIPTLVGIMVLLITGQLLIGRSEFWLPQFVLRRSVSRKRFNQAIRVMRKVARFIDRLTEPRLRVLTNGPSMHVIAALCLVISLVAPVMELLPFVITGVGAAVSAFGLALLAHDGLLALLAFGFSVAVVVTAAITLL